jgi:site-specific recombinase XerD
MSSSKLPVPANSDTTLSLHLPSAVTDCDDNKNCPLREQSRASDYARAEKSDATRKAYRSDFEHFTTWCNSRALAPLPASIETAAAYLAHLADSGLKASTITRRVAAITYAHRLAGLPPPTAAEPVKAVLRGIRRRIGTAVERKAPVTARAIAAMLKRIPKDTIAGKRDRALLLLGFAAALRRSELVALDIRDVEHVPDGVVIHVRKSKTDQEGEGHEIAIPHGARLKPVESLVAWLEARAALATGRDSDPDRAKDGNAGRDLSGVTGEPSVNQFPEKPLPSHLAPLFVSIRKGVENDSKPSQNRLSDRAVALIVKRWAKAARLDPALFAGHSLRAGFVTSALDAGADVLKIMSQTRHKRVDTLKIYDRRANLFKQHAGKRFL